MSVGRFYSKSLTLFLNPRQLFSWSLDNHSLLPKLGTPFTYIWDLTQVASHLMRRELQHNIRWEAVKMRQQS